MEKKPLIGILGGSGLYHMEDLEALERREVSTPFGVPSDSYVIGRLHNTDVAFLARHGKGHSISATGVNYRANIYGFKELGAEIVISVNAVGSLKEEYHPTDIFIPTQYIDLTKKRENSFFPSTPAVHVDVADPFCANICEALYRAGMDLGASIYMGGVYVCIEGPSFSTRAESFLYRHWNADVIGMTAATEAKLCREAEICYASLSMVTDYDVWKEHEAEVTAELILSNMQKAVVTAKDIIRTAIEDVSLHTECDCRRSLRNAIATVPDAISPQTIERLPAILSKYFPREER